MLHGNWKYKLKYVFIDSNMRPHTHLKARATVKKMMYARAWIYCRTPGDFWQFLALVPDNCNKDYNFYQRQARLPLSG